MLSFNNSVFFRAKEMLFAGVVLLGLAALLSAEEPQGNYRLWSVTTDLQRLLLSPDATAFGVINANHLIQDGRIDPTALGLPEFRRELAALAKDHSESLALYLRFQNWQRQPAAEDFLEAALVQFGKKAGFVRVVSGRNYTGTLWEDALAAVLGSREREGGEESPVQDEQVRAYPVRTSLSRYLTGNADCVVVVRTPLDGRSDGLPDLARRSMETCIAQLRLDHKKSLSFRIVTTRAGEPAADRFIGPTGGAQQLAASLGFEHSMVTQSRTAGDPQRLIGQKAPDFTLPGLDGREIRLSDTIRDCVAYVTFWGVACGPCRAEAPHLSELSRRFRNSGFRAIAVNAYDESQDVVRKYADEYQLTHTIALSGAQVARDKYGVGAYPTSFWVDWDGVIIDYEIGFDAGDEQRMARTIERLLHKKE